jgi:4-carboxymuconolactone decarboxylase
LVAAEQCAASLQAPLTGCDEVEKLVPRIPFPEVEAMTPAQRKVYDEVVGGPRGMMVGPLRAALHNAELADRWQKFGALLRYRTSLDPRHSELAILVTAKAWSCAFEWVQHETAARTAGLDSNIIEDIRAGRAPVFERSDDAAVYNYAQELHATRTIGDATYADALEVLGVTGVVELTALIGYYTLVAMTLNAHVFDLPPGARNPFEGEAA